MIFTFNPDQILATGAAIFGATGAGFGVSLTPSQVRDYADLASTDTPSFSGVTLSGNLLFSPTNTIDVGDGVYDPRTVRAATSVLTPLLKSASGTLGINSDDVNPVTIGSSTDGNYFETGGVPTLKFKVSNSSRAKIGYAGLQLSTGNGIYFSNSLNNADSTADGCISRSGVGRIAVTTGTNWNSGGTFGTLDAAAVDHTSAALTLGNSTHGVSSPGNLTLGATKYLWTATGPEILVGRDGGGFYLCGGATGHSESIFIGTTSSPVKIQSNAILGGQNAALTLGNSTYGVAVPGQIAVSGNIVLGATAAWGTFFGNTSTSSRVAIDAHAPSIYDANNSPIFRVIGGAELILRNAYGVKIRNLPDTADMLFSAGAATFSGDISMSKTSAQGYLNLYSPDLSKLLYLYANNSGTGVLAATTNISMTSASGAVSVTNNQISLSPTNGNAYVYVSGTNSTFDVCDSSGAKYLRSTHDGTYGKIGTSSGTLVLEPATAMVSLYKSGSDANLFVVNGANTQWVTIDSNSININTGNLSLRPSGGTAAVVAYGDISMQKATQGYIYAYDTGGTKYTRMYATSGASYVEGNHNELTLKAVQGYVDSYTSGVNGSFRAWNSTGAYNTRLTHDGTNGIVSTSSGALVLSAATSIIGLGGITSSYPALKRSSTTLAVRLGDDSADAPISCAGITASGAVLQTAEVTNTPSGTTQTVTLSSGNHQTLALASSTGDVTVTLTVPSSSAAGTLLVSQHATTARDITWAASAGSIIWLGTEPTWNTDATSSVRMITWRYNGTNTYLTASGAS